MSFTINKELFTIHTFTGGYDKNITYLIQPIDTENVWTVDASVSIENIPYEFRDKIKGIFITHTHGDHIAYLGQYVTENPDTSIYIHEESSYTKFSQNKILVSDEEFIDLNQLKIKVLHTPGHYPDSCCFLLYDSLFTGDTVFIGRTGRTISIGSNVRTLFKSVYEKILTLPQNLTIFPGHDYGPKPYCSIEENIKISPLLQAEGEDDFVFRMEEYERNRLS
jgi:glyoxylase-like metal-dependent hydrolase (beta-lactamase superfamily II)